jgi:hypothetical protein
MKADTVGTPESGPAFAVWYAAIAAPAVSGLRKTYPETLSSAASQLKGTYHVLKILANIRVIDHDFNPVGCKKRGIADARKLQELR